MSKLNDEIMNAYNDRDKFFIATGYFLDNEPRVDLKLIKKTNIDYDTNEEFMVSDFKRFWRSTIKNRLEKCARANLVLLSGGLDSRAILMELLEHFESKKINTLTFGVPGSLDFELGNKVAAYFKTNHQAVVVDERVLTEENLIKFGQNTDFSCNLFLTPPINELETYKDFNIWSGTVIDVFFGRHMHELPDAKGAAMRAQFLQENRIIKLPLKISDEYIEENLILQNSGQDLPHEADLLNRQAKFVAKHLLLKNYHFINLLSPELINFGMRLPQDMFADQKFYKRCFQHMYPYFDKIGNKTTYGARLQSNFLSKLFHRGKNKCNRYAYLNYRDWETDLKNYDFSGLISKFVRPEYVSIVNQALLRPDDPFLFLNLISLEVIKHEQ